MNFSIVVDGKFPGAGAAFHFMIKRVITKGMTKLSGGHSLFKDALAQATSSQDVSFKYP